jgi:hypothetical protein
MNIANASLRNGFLRNAPIVGIAAASLLGLWAVGSPSLPITEFDSEAAENRLMGTIPFHQLLHKEEQAPDGTRGFGLPMPTAMRVARPSPLPSPFITDLEWDTYEQYCAWDAIVRVTHIDSTPVLTRDKTLVYTIYHFFVTDIIKSDLPVTPGQILVAYGVGGEVEDDGEILKIDTPDSAAFEPKKSYILILSRDKGASARQYYIPQVHTIIVTNDKVYPISEDHGWPSTMDAFPSGSTYTDIRNTFIKAHRLRSCSAPR